MSGGLILDCITFFAIKSRKHVPTLEVPVVIVKFIVINCDNVADPVQFPLFSNCTLVLQLDYYDRLYACDSIVEETYNTVIFPATKFFRAIKIYTAGNASNSFHTSWYSKKSHLSRSFSDRFFSDII